jgi:hypothetical protein
MVPHVAARKAYSAALSFFVRDPKRTFATISATIGPRDEWSRKVESMKDELVVYLACFVLILVMLVGGGFPLAHYFFWTLIYKIWS